MYTIAQVMVLLAAFSSDSSNWKPQAWILDRFAPVTVEASLVIGQRTVAPFGAVVFCHRFPESCQAQAARAVAVSNGRVVISDAMLERVAAINVAVNRRIKPKIDNLWHIGGPTGDCKDYALTKRDMLTGMGFPTSATLIATGLAPSGKMHAVLVLRTDRGDFVLDNLTPAIRRWDMVRYGWEKIQSPTDPAVWLSIGRPSI